MTRAFLLSLLAASMAANIWFLIRTRRDDGSAAVHASHATSKALPLSRAATSAPSLATTHVHPAPKTEAEFRALRTQLEALGLAPPVVRTVIAMLLNQWFQQRIAALQGHPDPDQYWLNRSARHADTRSEAFRDLTREQRRLFRELVGSDLEMDETAHRRQFGGLPDTKVEQLKKIFADYTDLEEQTFGDSAGPAAPNTRARLELLAREKRADIERLLTPEELLNYDLRTSNAAHQLRGRIGQFDVTEEEFRALYPGFKAALDAFGEGGNGRTNSAASRAARETRDRQLDEQLRRVLGEERYRALQEANDTMLQQTRTFTAQLNLPPQIAQDVVAVQREFGPQLTAIDRDRDLSPNQRDARASALGLAAREKLIGLLGPEGFEAYKRQGGGWLGAALSRIPPTPSPVP